MENIKFEKMRYNNNSLGYLLCLLGVIFSLLAGFINLNTSNPKSVAIFIKIALIVFIFLFGFLSAEKLKVYDKKYSYVTAGLAATSLLRIFWYPLHIIIAYGKFVSASEIKDGQRVWLTDASLDTKAYAENWLGKLIVHGAGNSIRILPQSGYFRGIVSLVLLLISATAFAFAAYISFKKSSQLENYLKQIKIEK